MPQNKIAVTYVLNFKMGMDKYTNKLIKLFKQNNLTLAMAVSMTCGLAAASLGNTHGPSYVLKGSIVCYSPDVKKTVLKIPESSIKKYTCESKEITQMLAKNLQTLIANPCIAGRNVCIK